VTRPLQPLYLISFQPQPLPCLPFATPQNLQSLKQPHTFAADIIKICTSTMSKSEIETARTGRTATHHFKEAD